MAEEIGTLDYYVRKALDFLEQQKDYEFQLPPSEHTLVVGSQTGLLTGRIVYRFAGRSFSHAKEVLAQFEIETKKDIEDITIVSATGSRQAVHIADYALECASKLKKELRVNAILCDFNDDDYNNSELRRNFGGKINTILVPAIKEPPTVNTATYGMMIKAVTKESIPEIRQVVESLREPEGGYGQFKAFTVISTDGMPEVAEMVDWKLRGEKIGRCVGSMSTHLTNFMHGGAINDADEELYVALGLADVEKEVFEQVLEPVAERRKHYVDVPEGFGPLGLMMVGYSVVGQIQRAYPDFQKNIGEYGRRAKQWKWLSPISTKG
ncbi:MAG: hypothetical protein JSW47_13345 [Phycisphaerales bacterium]|nr:MAG: hypothetical protein JSW47_13345 [Phycisphaerales bacterium]